MRKILSELFLLIIIGFIAFFVIKGIIVANAPHAMQVQLDGKISKDSLLISSPIYGEITSLPVYTGSLVKKGQTLAVLKIISKPQGTALVNTNVFTFTESTVTISSPTDGTVASLNATNGSTVTPQSTFLTIYPFNKTTVAIDLPNTDSIKNYKNFSVSINQDNPQYPVTLMHAYPVNADQDNQVFFAQFQNNSTSGSFYNNEKVIVTAEKIPSDALTPVQSALRQVSDWVTQVLKQFKR